MEVLRESVFHQPFRPSTVALADADPELVGGTSARLVCHERRLPLGPWSEPERSLDDRALGFLVLEGLIAREVLLSDNVATELLGPGDLLRPWDDESPPQLLRTKTRWTVLEPARLAVLDQRVGAQLTTLPAACAALLRRVTERGNRLAVMQAIAQLNGVEHRVLALLWHLAEDWGRVTARGTKVPLELPHRMIAQLVGARRPTVSSAIGELERSGAIERLAEGGWLLTGEPVGAPTTATIRDIRVRRFAKPAR